LANRKNTAEGGCATSKLNFINHQSSIINPTSSFTNCCLLIDPPASGAWNMAVDEVLLEEVSARGGCWWRFYRWEEPTLSLGYFQSCDDRRRHAPSRGCPVVRRLSGGGAIMHDVEVTYSFAVAASHPLASARERLYETVHATLLDVLRDWGIEASLVGPSPRRVSGVQPLLCFERHCRGDVLVGRSKIAGSAQRRRRRAILQHGSVLLGRSAAAPELDGLKELAGRAIDPQRLVEVWLERLGRRLELTFHPKPLSPEQRRRAAELVRTKYGSASWTIYRGR
jgi:lipoate-protein ligase A